MKFAHPHLGKYIDFDIPYINTLVIENQKVFFDMLNDVHNSISGNDTPCVLSINDKTADMSKYAELVTDFLNFDVNRKTLLNKVTARLEQIAVDAENFMQTNKLLAAIEKSIEKWAFELPCDIISPKITVAGILKAAGVELRCDYTGSDSIVEKLIDYMELIREFDKNRLIITVNLRSYINDGTALNFMKNVLSKEFYLLMIENCEHERLECEKRIVIDKDLCEF